MMRNKWIIVFCLLLELSCSKQNEDEQQMVEDTLYAGLEFNMPKVQVPSFPSFEVSIIDFGAVPDGITINTKAFSEAIKHVSEQGGGKVVIPRGIWLTGPITLKNNINLEAEAGALILFSRDFNDYPLIKTSFEGLNTYRCLSPINGTDLTNIAISGDGVFDGSGDAWRPVKKSKLTSSHWKQLVASGGVLNEKQDVWYPSESALKGVDVSNMNVPQLKTEEDHLAIKDFLRPVMVSLVSCKNVLIDGPTFQNSPAWCLHPLMCENVTIRNVSVKNPWYSQNGDGLDLESCKNAVIHHCSFDVGDDAICIKSGKDADGRKRGIPTENVIIKECVVYHGHGGFTVGSEMSGGVKNIHVSGLTFIGTDVGLRFKSTRGRGGVVENIYISSINMVNIPAEAILFDLYYTGNSPIPEGDEKVTVADKKKMANVIPEVTEETPSFKNIFIRDVVCKGAGRAILLQGLPEMNLKNMNLKNIKIESVTGLVGRDIEGVNLSNVSIHASESPAIFLYNSKQVKITDFKYDSTVQPIVRIWGNLTSNINFKEANVVQNQVEVGPSVENSQLIFNNL